MGADRLVYIRTDGNAKIASGHLVRCFSVALACQKLGMEVRFLVSDEESHGLLEEIMGAHNIFPVTQLKTAAFAHLEQELPEVLSLVSTPSPTSSKGLCDTCVTSRKPIYLLDSYYVTEKYLSTLRPLVNLAYIDDLRLFDYSVDLLINYDVIPDTDMPSYRAFYQNPGQLLLGASYAPLRSQFQNCQTPVREKVSDVLVTTGGSDPYHFCLHLMQQTASLPAFTDASGPTDMKFHVIIGKLNMDKEMLYRLADRFSFFQLHENVDDMASLMAGCDLAVSAAGTTLYELCALGIPSISFTMADNQLDAAKAFDAAGAIPHAGDVRTDSHHVFQEVLRFITENAGFSADSYAKRKAAHNRMNSLVDGNGALRIGNALQRFFA